MRQARRPQAYRASGPRRGILDRVSGIARAWSTTDGSGPHPAADGGRKWTLFTPRGCETSAAIHGRSSR